MEEFFDRVRPYNLWDKNEVPAGFKRDAYIGRIGGYIGNNRIVKVLVGQRRAGKSYIMRQVANSLVAVGVNPKNILMVNKEFEAFSFVETHKDLYELICTYERVIVPEGKVYLFIDEIQEIEGWERVVNSCSQDYTKEYEIFISGSNSRMLSGELSTLLSGRYIEFKVFPFSYKEYCDVLGLQLGRESFIDYMQGGGLPELFNLNGSEARRNYISAVKDTVLLKDIIQLYLIKDVKLLEDIFVYLVNNASNMVSITNIVNWFKSKGRKTTYDTVANYVGYICDAWLVHKAERYNIKGKDVVAGNCKFYINDLSFKNYLYKGFAYGAGYLLENLVYLELLRNGYNVHVGNIKDKEVDFVALKDDETLYVQVCYMLMDEETVMREYSSLEAIADNYRKVVVSLDDVQLGVRNGIEHVRAWEFGKWLGEEN